jgi:Flp pilus assembly protein TadG
VEFALVAVLFFMLIFGIMGYAFMMSFQQSLTQAAAEGARAGAVAAPGEAVADAERALEEAMGGFGVTCDSAGMTCTVELTTCGTAECVEVTVAYEYRDHALLPTVPLVDRALPDVIDYTAVAEVNA